MSVATPRRPWAAGHRARCCGGCWWQGPGQEKEVVLGRAGRSLESGQGRARFAGGVFGGVGCRAGRRFDVRGELPPRTSACVCILLVRTNEGVGCVFHFGSSIWELYCCDAARSQSERPTPAGAAGNTAPSPIRAEHTHAANIPAGWIRWACCRLRLDLLAIAARTQQGHGCRTSCSPPTSHRK